MKIFKSFYLVLLSGLMSVGMAFSAYAAEINGGSRTGSYTTAFAPLIQKVLAGEFFQYEIKPSAGSVEAAQRLLEDPRDVSLAQLDAAYDFMKKNPGKIILTKKLANECLFAVSRDERLSDWAKVERLAPRLRMTTAAEKSGSAFTLRSVMQMDPKSRLSQAVSRIKYSQNAKEAVEQVARGRADIAFFVAYPDPNSTVFKFANANKLNFIGVAHPNMRRMKTEQGDPIYTANEIAVEKEGFISKAKTVQTACTAAVILTGNPEQFLEGTDDRTNQQDLVNALKNASNDSLRPKGDKWDRIFKAVKNVTGETANNLWTAGGQLVENVADQIAN